jgi:L-aspartate oxidase
MIGLDPGTHDCVIIGSGIAGLVTALSLAPMRVLLITRGSLGAESSSAWAQGGIAASMGDDDDVALHVADTIAAGNGLCDAEAVRAIVSAAPQAIVLLERHGVRFDRDEHGRLALGLEAAHGRRRIVHVRGDGSGAAIVTALADAVLRTPSISVLEDVEALRLIVDEHGAGGLVCATTDGIVQLAARRIVLATGGVGGLYRTTTNPAGNFGQGIALAARAGAVLADMEFVQFHPTALDTGQMPLPLVSEAVRGEGAILLNEHGERFMGSSAGAELAPRDVVARAISGEIDRGGRVFLDARPALGARFAARFPAIDRFCKQAGIDPSQMPIPVCPAVHYHMGGIATDLNGRSTVSGVWVVGEAACTGLHGANRLASNSLLEAVVMAARAARDIAGSNSRAPATTLPVSVASRPDPEAIRTIVTRHLGLFRHERGLETAVAHLARLVLRDGVASDPAIVALLVAVFALGRRESRGAHARTDFPAPASVASRQAMTLAAALDLAGAINLRSLSRSA